MSAPTRATVAARAYLDLRNKARGDRRPVDELFQLYALEAFLARLAGSPYADQLVLKGGVLLAAFGERRPTRDVDLQGEVLDNDIDNIRQVICEVAAQALDDGVVFEIEHASAEVIRDEDAYSGVRVSLRADLATARLHLHVDINVGDPITPAPQEVHLPRLLGGEVVVRGYPLVMVLAEKIVTAIARGLSTPAGATLVTCTYWVGIIPSMELTSSGQLSRWPRTAALNSCLSLGFSMAMVRLVKRNGWPGAGGSSSRTGSPNNLKR